MDSHWSLFAFSEIHTGCVRLRVSPLCVRRWYLCRSRDNWRPKNDSLIRTAAAHTHTATTHVCHAHGTRWAPTISYNKQKEFHWSWRGVPLSKILKNLQFAPNKQNYITQWTANYNQSSMSFFFFYIKCVHVDSNRAKRKKAFEDDFFLGSWPIARTHTTDCCADTIPTGARFHNVRHDRNWSTVRDAETEHIRRSMRWRTWANIEKPT